MPRPTATHKPPKTTATHMHRYLTCGTNKIDGGKAMTHGSGDGNYGGDSAVFDVFEKTH